MSPLPLWLLTLWSVLPLVWGNSCYVNKKSKITECYNVTLDKDHPLSPTEYTETLRIFPTLKELPSKAFIKVPNIKILILNYTMMDRIHENTFAGLENLIALDLYWNEIDYIPPQTFYNCCSRLSYLNLGGNDLKYLERPVFRALTYLEELILTTNMLNSIPDFSSQSQLKHLDLSKNKIPSVGRRDLFGLLELRRLNLRNNRISFIEEGAFSHLQDLEFLNLEWNGLTMLDVDDLTKGLVKLKEVRVGVNKFSCKNLRQIVTDLLRRNISVPEGLAEPEPITFHGWFCYPPEMKISYSDFMTLFQGWL